MPKRNETLKFTANFQGTARASASTTIVDKSYPSSVYIAGLGGGAPLVVLCIDLMVGVAILFALSTILELGVLQQEDG